MHAVDIELNVAPVSEIEPVTLYRILALRVQVFVLEQGCAYDELDGRDLEPDAVLLWAAQNGEPLATLRILIEANGTARIGRVATAAVARSAGLAGRLMEAALLRCGQRTVVLGAQAPLQSWYAKFGFVRSGDDYDDDGITHVPMRRSVTE